MRLNLQILLLFCVSSINTYGQDVQSTSLNIGDMAPPLRVKEWIKGTPVDSFEKGKIYVVEFWATWCKPCRAAMPHLSSLAHKYKSKVTFIGMDVYENFEHMHVPLPRVKKFVDSMGKRMNYNVAAEDSNFMETDWLLATGADHEDIPRAFVINNEGKLVWIGYPAYLNTVLPKILNNTWDIKLALNTRLLNKKLFYLDDSIYYDLYKFRGDEERDTDNGHKPDFIGKPDSILFAVHKILQTESELKYTPWLTYYIFTSLLKTDMHKAYEYGKEATVTRPSIYDDPTYETFDTPPFDMIINGVESFSDELKLTPEIYQLGAEAYQEKINHDIYPKLVNLSKYYQSMAAWYWLANNKSKAIHAQHKAIKALKREENYFSKTGLIALKLQLKKYKRNNPS